MLTSRTAKAKFTKDPLNGDLLHAAKGAVFALRFGGHDIPESLWAAATTFLVAVNEFEEAK